METPIIQAADIWKQFKLYTHRPTTLKHMLVGSERPTWDEFWVLRAVDLEIAPGATLGLVGRNGSGKSTLLRVIARIYRPTRGRVVIRGRVAPLLEIGAGFHPELTGRENIFLNGSLLGFSRRDMKRRFEDIVDFSELARFIDTPVKFYSSGMYMRLGFAVAINVEPDVLLVDEVLAVGDEEFQRKCLERVRSLNAAGTALVLVSHQAKLLESTCRTCVWLDEGRVRGHGAMPAVLSDYRQDLT